MQIYLKFELIILFLQFFLHDQESTESEDSIIFFNINAAVPQPIQIIQFNNGVEVIDQLRFQNNGDINIPIINLIDENEEMIAQQRVNNNADTTSLSSITIDLSDDEYEDIIEIIEIDDNSDDSFDNMMIINNPNDAQHTRGIICPVCRRATRIINARSTLCGHLFCNDCIFQSYSNNYRCPLCLEIILHFESEVHRIFL